MAAAVDPRALVLATVTEKEWQSQVLVWATEGGWAVHHAYDSRRSEAGFPDLTLVREQGIRYDADAGVIVHGELLFAELKTERGVVETAQWRWLDLLAGAGAEVHVWRPRDEIAVRARLARLPVAA